MFMPICHVVRSFPSGTGPGSSRSSTGRSAQNGRGLTHGLLLRLLPSSAIAKETKTKRKIWLDFASNEETTKTCGRVISGAVERVTLAQFWFVIIVSHDHGIALLVVVVVFFCNRLLLPPVCRTLGCRPPGWYPLDRVVKNHSHICCSFR